MSKLTYRLETERPSRKLCVDAATRIAQLEDALIEIERHAYGIEPLKTSLLKRVQTALYDRDVVLALAR